MSHRTQRPVVTMAAELGAEPALEAKEEEAKPKFCAGAIPRLTRVQSRITQKEQLSKPMSAVAERAAMKKPWTRMWSVLLIWSKTLPLFGPELKIMCVAAPMPSSVTGPLPGLMVMVVVTS